MTGVTLIAKYTLTFHNFLTSKSLQVLGFFSKSKYWKKKKTHFMIAIFYDIAYNLY